MGFTRIFLQCLKVKYSFSRKETLVKLHVHTSYHPYSFLFWSIFGFLWQLCFRIIYSFMILYISIKIKNPQMRKHMMFVFNRWETCIGLLFWNAKTSTFLPFQLYQDNLKYCSVDLCKYNFHFSFISWKTFIWYRYNVKRVPSMLHHFKTLYENNEI